MPAIRASRTEKVYIQNIMTHPAETTDLTMADHLQALIDHCGGVLFPTVLANTRTLSKAILRKYQQENAHPVELDRHRVLGMGMTIVERDLLSEDETIRHDPELLARASLELCAT